ncbi:hypothetical protein ABC347_15105 [Sphingomonas sp. 1P06PA]|uniref:hypothetical protein n=1 Tax=Sphingomonas sp. 1P06PA TaxID=554121 RepID=UPI0039A6A938
MAKTFAARLARFPIEPVMASLLAASTGFALHAMPQPLLEAIVAASGLPGLIDAATPPLGHTARSGVVFAGALAAFLLVWAIFWLIDHWPQRAAVDTDAERDYVFTPRAEDAHPDAPVRRPIFAAADLGNPVARVPEPEGNIAQRARIFPDPPAEPLMVEHVAVDEPEAELEPLLLDTPFVDPEPIPSDVAGAAPPETVVVAPSETPAPDPIAATPTAAAPVPPPGPPRSTAELMARLEAGLARRATRDQAPADDVDGALRAALADLGKLAKRG